MRSRRLEHCRWTALRRRSGENGQALIETALTVPLLFLLLLGAAELARVAYAAIKISNAARAGAQYAVRNDANMWDKGGITTAAQNDAGTSLSGVTASPTIGYSCSDSSSYSSFTGCANALAVSMPYVTVTTSVTFDPLIHLPFLPNTINLNGQATEYCEDCE